MIWHICSISVYILKFVTSPFIFIEANAIFQISSLKSVFSGAILYLFSFLLKCCYKYKQVISLRISLKRFCLISFCSLFHVLIYSKIFKLKYIHFVLLGSRGWFLFLCKNYVFILCLLNFGENVVLTITKCWQCHCLLLFHEVYILKWRNHLVLIEAGPLLFHKKVAFTAIKTIIIFLWLVTHWAEG